MENCVRHVVNNTSEPIEIHLEATSDAEDLILDVTCSGGSFGDDILKLGQGQGIGLANTRARLAAAFGTRASMNLENLAQGDTPAGTRVRLRLPLNTQP
jgi:LytS/YehU family sensor histidine kinase